MENHIKMDMKADWTEQVLYLPVISASLNNNLIPVGCLYPEEEALNRENYPLLLLTYPAHSALVFLVEE
jgi:hypothetical protein